MNSHIFPRFYIKWMRADGGRLRRPVDPNKPEQDGPKVRLLCGECEERFGRREKAFASEFFHPWTTRKATPESYSADTHYFLVSLLWRCLGFCLKKPRPEVVPWIPRLEAATEDWRSYLLEAKNSPLCDQVHMALLDVGDTALDTCIAVSSGGCMVFARMGMFISMAYIDQDDVWQETRIHVKGGRFPGPRRIDVSVFEFLVERGLVSTQMYGSRLSSKQRENVSRRKGRRPQ